MTPIIHKYERSARKGTRIPGLITRIQMIRIRPEVELNSWNWIFELNATGVYGSCSSTRSFLYGCNCNNRRPSIPLIWFDIKAINTKLIFVLRHVILLYTLNIIIIDIQHSWVVDKHVHICVTHIFMESYKECTIKKLDY